MEKGKRLMAGPAGETARQVLLEERPWRSAGPGERALRVLALTPTALLLALAVLSICREAGAIHPLYTLSMAAAVLGLAVLARLAGQRRVWLAVLFLGAVWLRFLLGRADCFGGDCLAEWNLALELAAGSPGQWPDVVAAVGGGMALKLPHILYVSLLVRLFGPSLTVIRLCGALWGGLSCLLTALTAERLAGSRRAGLTAGVLLACCPTLLFSVELPGPQPLYTALLTAGLWLLVCRPFGRPCLSAALAGLAWGLSQVLWPGLPVPLLAAGAWLLLTLPGRPRGERLPRRCACFLGAFLAAALALGLAESALTGTNVLDPRLTARAAIGLNAETAGQYNEADRPLLEGEASAADAIAQRRQGLTESLKLALRKVRLQFGSYDYQQSLTDRGGSLQNELSRQAAHPAFQSYMLAVLALALAGTVLSFRRMNRAGLLPYALLLGCLGASVFLDAAPEYNSCVIPLLAVWAAPPAAKLAEWSVQTAAPENKKKPPLPPALAAARLVLSTAAYAAMLALVLVFFTGHGAFIYEAF